ncbi:MAG: type II CAAX prenyl endopeptidase Rce1 family protein, partial [Candidatus Hydrothermarchaeales archaeon]
YVETKCKSKHWTLIVSSIVFGLYHALFLDKAIEINVLGSKTLMGIVFGLPLYWRRDLRYGIFAHFINNLLSVLMA